MNATIDELILLAGGAFLTVLGVWKINERRKLLKIGIKVEGVVFKIEEEQDKRGISYYPVIRYVTLEKEWITKKYNTGTNPPAYKEGDTVNVIYDPIDKEHFIVDNLSGKITGLMLGLFGILLIVGVVIYYILHQL
jgi:hypothetical protein